MTLLFMHFLLKWHEDLQISTSLGSISSRGLMKEYHEWFVAMWVRSPTDVQHSALEALCHSTLVYVLIGAHFEHLPLAMLISARRVILSLKYPWISKKLVLLKAFGENRFGKYKGSFSMKTLTSRFKTRFLWFIHLSVQQNLLSSN